MRVIMQTEARGAAGELTSQPASSHHANLLTKLCGTQCATSQLPFLTKLLKSPPGSSAVGQGALGAVESVLSIGSVPEGDFRAFPFEWRLCDSRTIVVQ